MSQILNKLRDVEPNNSEAIKGALSPFLQHLPNYTEGSCGHWLRALENALNRFPKYCMPQRGNIESYLANFLDCNNYYVVIEAAKCALALQQVRPMQEKTATAKSSWRDQMNALCNAAHALLGAMFPDAVDIYQQMEKIQKVQQPSSSPLATALSQLSSTTASSQNKVLNKQILLSTRLRNVFVFIQAMLVEVYPVAKPIRPQTILDVIVRALSMSSGNNVNQNIADVVVVKTQALRSLDALIACLGSNLIPFSPLVFRFVMQTLKWCSDNPGEQSSKVRCSAYSSLGRWLSTLRSHRATHARGRCWQDELADHVLADITPRKHVVELTMSSQPTKNLSKKAKRKLANSLLMESNMSSHVPGGKHKMTEPEELNEEVAIAALECAEIFFVVCGMFLKPTIHKRFQERLVRSCYSLHELPAAHALALLRALEAARKGAPPAAPPHTHLAARLYSTVHSPHAEISNFCAQALLDIRMHLHCGPPTLSFAVEVEPGTQKKEETRKQISERNRTALEALLGAHKVPKQTEEVVITIADEPSSKRRKLDETNKIRMISESASIEISDDSDSEDDVVQEVQVVVETVVGEPIHPGEEVDIVPIVKEAKTLNDVQIENESEPEQGNINTTTIDITQEDIHNQVTQMPNAGKDISENKVDSTQPGKVIVLSGESVSIYNVATQLPPNTTTYKATTQLPLNVSNDDEDQAPLSMEVAYDYPNTGNEKVTVLEKLDADNLPSTNETDDIQITCGQIVKNSQDVDLDTKKLDIGIKSYEVKTNRNDVSTGKPVQNGEVTESSLIATVASKDLNVEDMLADFVDEVNNDTQTPATQA